MKTEIVTLKAGSASLSLCPRIGGAISALTYQGIPLLRPIGEADLAAGNVRAMASYPLIPYSNRIRHGIFAFEGTPYHLSLNFGDHPHSIHGNAWQSTWSYKKEKEDQAVLSLRHDPDTKSKRAAWPFAYEARQEFHLRETALDIHLWLRNADDRPMPAGLGIHPFFPKTKDTRLFFDAAEVWETNETVLPIRKILVPQEWKFTEERDVEDLKVDNVFADWKGMARLMWPSHKLALTMTADSFFDRLVIFTTPGRDSIAIEPVSHDTDAFNRMAAGDRETGAVVLRPGQTLEGQVRFTWEKKDG